jgi:hypothetical protein
MAAMDDPRRHLRLGTTVDVQLSSRSKPWRGVVVGVAKFNNGAVENYIVRRKNGNRPWVYHEAVTPLSDLEIFIRRVK